MNSDPFTAFCMLGMSRRRLWWIAAKPLLDPALACLAVYGALHWPGSFAWVLVLGIAPGGHGYTLNHAGIAIVVLASKMEAE